MNINYYKWLEFEVTHSYFPDGVSSIFSLIPFEDTGRLMHNYNMLLNAQRNSVSFYAGIDNEAEFLISQQFEGITNLYFQLIVTEATFFNYTNLKPTSEEQLCFLTNLNSVDEEFQLHRSEFVSEIDQISSLPKRFNYSIPAGDSILEVKTENGAVVFVQEFSNSGPINYLVNLDQLEDGAYELWLNNQLGRKFFLSNQSLDVSCIGVVQINMETLISHNKDSLKYHIDFDSRSVHWRYKIVVPASRKIEVQQMSITGIAGENYEGPIEEPLMADQTASIFTSDIALPLKYSMETTPILKITYTSNFSDNGTLELKLPIPGAESISKNTNEENEDSFFSSTIIYV
jgi:hypothetical protein